MQTPEIQEPTPPIPGPWAAGVAAERASKPPAAEHHNMLSMFGIEASDKVSNIVFLGTVATGALILAPVVLPWIAQTITGETAKTATDVFSTSAKDLATNCCQIVGTSSGLTGMVTSAIETVGEYIPVVGTYLNTSALNNKSIVNALVPAITIIGGYGAGTLITQLEKTIDPESKGRVGSAIRATGMVLGVVLSLPAVLPAIGHGIEYATELAGKVAGAIPPLFSNPNGSSTDLLTNEKVGEQIKEGIVASGHAIGRLIGNTEICTSYATGNGLRGSASLLGGHLACVLPAFIVGAPAVSAVLAEQAKSADMQGRSR